MRPWRSLLCALCLAGGLSAAGCTDHGSYEVTWTFDTEPTAAGLGCGSHGVDAIHVTGASMQGDGEDVITLCAPGDFTHAVPVGDWTFTFHQVDVRGRPIVLNDAQGPVPDQTATATIIKDQTIKPPLTLVLTARPQCDDGIDNDGDGLVDLDDPTCAGDPSTAME